MKNDNTKLGLFDSLHKFFKEKSASPGEYLQRSTDFIRNRRLSFDRVVIFLLQMAKKSLSVELECFFEQLGEEELCVTKSAFTQARYKIAWKFFEDWNAQLVREFEQSKEIKERRYKGMRLYGIDGSTLYLVNNEDMRAHFGVQENGCKQVAMARTVCRYDLLNNLCDYARLNKIESDELTYAIEQVESLPPCGLGIHDRGHASFALMYIYRRSKRHFLIRCSSTFNGYVKSFVQSTQKSKIIKMQATTTAIERLQTLGIRIDKTSTVLVRLLKVKLPGGETEILMTSLDEKAFPRKRLRKLYFLRWGVETFFDRLKNKLQVEKFCGHLPKAVYQEFFAIIFLSNLHALMVRLCCKTVKQIAKNRKYDYQINANVTLGLLRLKLVAIFLLGNLQQTMEHLLNKFVRYLEPIRPNRSFPRIVKTKRTKGKYQTHTNYRPAA